MSAIYKEGKDTIIFASEEEYVTPSKIDIPELEPSPGLILPNGDINWNCPCLGGMATGPCGVEFREAFSCFHYSTSEPKGTECYEAFKVMQTCMSQYPALYGNKDSGTSDDISEDDISQIDNDSQPPVKENVPDLNSSEEVLHLKKDLRSEIVSKH